MDTWEQWHPLVALLMIAIGVALLPSSLSRD